MINIAYQIKYKIIYDIRQTMAMNRIHSHGSSGSGAQAGLAGGAPGRSGAPLTGPAGAPLPPLLPLLWYLIHSCSLPYVVYFFNTGRLTTRKNIPANVFYKNALET